MLVIHFINVLQNVKMLNRRSDCLQQFHCSKGQTYGYRTETSKSSPVFFMKTETSCEVQERGSETFFWMDVKLAKDCDHEVNDL